MLNPNPSRLKRIYFVIFSASIALLFGCAKTKLEDDEKYTCWVSQESIKTCNPAAIHPQNGLAVILKKSSAFCKQRPIFNSIEISKLPNEALNYTKNVLSRSVDFRCIWTEERWEYTMNDGCVVAGPLRRSGNKIITSTDYKSCGNIEKWDKKENTFYGVMDIDFANNTCKNFIQKIPKTDVASIEILPVDVIACEKYIALPIMLQAYNHLIDNSPSPARDLWRQICSQYTKKSNTCNS